MLGKEKTETDVLNRIRHDKILTSSWTSFSLIYADRFEGMKEIPFGNMHIEDEFFVTYAPRPKRIPIHRIRQFKYESKIVWDKRKIQ
jgi:uncharacterized protein (UPF0248 family)